MEDFIYNNTYMFMPQNIKVFFKYLNIKGKFEDFNFLKEYIDTVHSEFITKNDIIIATKHPLRYHEEDAGIDLALSEDIDYEKIDNINKFPTGVKINLPIGFVGILTPRSSCYKYGYTIINTPGVIDAGYRGEICMLVHIVNKERFEKLLIQQNKKLILPKGTRLAQLLILPAIYPNSFYEYINDIKYIIIENTSVFENFEKIFPSKRSSKGFGSTGRV